MALQLELLLRGERRVRVHLLLEHPQAVADRDDLLEEDLDRHVLGLDLGLARDEPQRSPRPSRGHLDLHVDPAVIAEHLPHRLPDAVELGIAPLLLHLEGVVAQGDAPRVAPAERDHVLPRLVRDDAADAKLQVADDRPDAEARHGRRVGTARTSALGMHRRILLA